MDGGDVKIWMEAVVTPLQAFYGHFAGQTEQYCENTSAQPVTRPRFESIITQSVPRYKVLTKTCPVSEYEKCLRILPNQLILYDTDQCGKRM